MACQSSTNSECISGAKAGVSHLSQYIPVQRKLGPYEKVALCPQSVYMSEKIRKPWVKRFYNAVIYIPVLKQMYVAKQNGCDQKYIIHFQQTLQSYDVFCFGNLCCEL